MIPKCGVNKNSRGDPFTPCGTRARFEWGGSEKHPHYVCTPCFWDFMKLGGEFGPFICLWKPADWMRDWDNWPLIIELPEGF